MMDDDGRWVMMMEGKIKKAQKQTCQKLLGMVWGLSGGVRMALQKFDSTQIYEKKHQKTTRGKTQK